MAKERKIHAVTVTVYVEQTGRPKLPTRAEIADGLVQALTGQSVEVLYGRDRLVQDMAVLGVYSNLATDENSKKGPDVSELRKTEG